MKVFIINNLGFAYNLIDQFKKLDCDVISYRNDVDIKIIQTVISKFKPNLIVISSGSEKDTGNSVDVILNYCGKIPIFGVGSGQLSILKAFEGRINKGLATHGKFIKVKHDGKTIFKKLSEPFIAGAYNSLCGSDIPLDFEVSARSGNDVVMGIRHKEYFVEGIQFDPSSILTVEGSLIIENLLKEIGKK